MLQMHGTADPIVPYQGVVFPTGMDSFLVATRTAEYWAEQNGCISPPDTIQLPDLDTTDQSQIRIFSYNNCSDSTEVLFYEVTGGGHTWPGGAPLPGFLGPVNRDISASSEIWNFFKRHTLPDQSVNTSQAAPGTSLSWQLYPNPFRNQLMIDLKLERQNMVEVRLLNLLGQPVHALPPQFLSSGVQQIMIRPSSTLPGGIYLLELHVGQQRATRKVIYRKN